MTRIRSTYAALAFGMVATAVGCGAEPPRQVTSSSRPNVDDGWKRSAVWLYATARGASGPQAECASSLEVLREESGCQGKLCRSASELATEWLDKCAKLAEDHVDEVSDLEAAMSDQAERKATSCFKQFDHFKLQGCDADKCLEEAQSWATRCGGTEGGPLTTMIVAQAVKRSIGTGEPVVLDARSCVSMAKQLREVSHCAGEEACKKAWPNVADYRERCESDEQLPDLATGLAQLAISLGAVKEIETILVSGEHETVAEGDVPLVLADGSGAVIGVCHKHPVKPVDYVAVRDRCGGARFTVAKLFEGEGSGALRVGRLTIPEDVPLTGPYPWLAVAGEPAALAEVRSVQLGDELDVLLAGPESEAVAKLVQTAHKFAPFIAEAAAAKQALRSRDAKLAPLLGKLATLKVAGAKQVNDPSARRGLLRRAGARPFADVRRDGKFELGAPTRAFWLDVAAVLPQAMKAYRAKLEPLAAMPGMGSKPAAVEMGRARERAADKGRDCASAAEQLASSAEQLEKCVFDECDDARVGELLAQWTEADGRAKAAWRELDMALSSTGSAGDGADIAKSAGCTVSRW